MPVCKYYLEGVCSRDFCPYRHVKVSDSAEICQDFLKGFCPLSENCMKRHENQIKPRTSTSAGTGNNSKESENKNLKKPTTAPSKPKRKSIGAATPKFVPPPEVKKRYFEEDESATTSGLNNASENNSTYASLESSFEQKRLRLLKKVEMAKKGLSGSTIGNQNINIFSNHQIALRLFF